MKKHSFLTIIFYLLLNALYAQLVIEGDTVVGNEWINFDQEYFKFHIAEDGVYRLSYEELNAAGIDLQNNPTENLVLYHLGEQIPVFISDPSNFGPGSFLEFYAKKNRGELDQYGYAQESHMLNPQYSLITDTSTYFITWDNEGKKEKQRIESVEQDLSGELPEPFPFYFHQEEMIFSDRHYKPTEQGTDYIKYSNLVPAEGFSSRITGDFKTEVISDHIYSSGGDPILQVRFGVNKVEHRIKLEWNGNEMKEYNLPREYQVVDEEFRLPISDLNEKNNFRLRGTLGNSDRVLVSQISLKYPRAFEFKDQSKVQLSIPAHNEEILIQLNEFKSNSNPIILDLTNNLRIESTKIGDTYQFLLDPSTSELDLFIYSADQFEEEVVPINLVNVDFTDFASLDHDFVIISNKKLFDDGNGNNWVQEYADYRASEQGGKYNPIIVDVEQLYDQFGYGIKRHYVSVNNFAFFTHRNWSSLRFFFVIGKGIEYPDYRTSSQQKSILTAPYYVPTWGAPGSDNLLFARKGLNYSMVPAGRLSATNPEEIKIYLDKVKAFESNNNVPQQIDEKYWTKRILHLSGGGNAQEQSIIALLLSRMEDIVEEEKFGAEVTTIRKSSTDPLQTSTSQEIIELINDGVSLITFFGHSAVGRFDFSLEEPEKYENAARLPMILSLGCYSGNIFVPSKIKGLSEAFVLEPEVGAVSFVAASGTAYLSAQGELGRRFYNEIANHLYAESIGEALREMFISLSPLPSIGYVTLLQQMTYHGDPSLSYITHEGPDFVIDYRSIQTEPNIISTSNSKFQVVFDVVNIGSRVKDSLFVQLQHILPDGEVTDTIIKKIEAPSSKSTITLDLNNVGLGGIGENRIKIVLDYTDKITEIPDPEAENNNTIIDPNGNDYYPFYVVDNAARPIYPRNFSIVSKPMVTLKASTSNLFTSDQKYIFQIDTSAQFDNPLEQKIVEAGGGLIEYIPSIGFENDKVYYWRIRPEEVNDVLGEIWNTSSFIYLEDSPSGWNQSHYFQYLENDFDHLLVNEQRSFQYDTNGFYITIYNKLWVGDLQPGYQFNYSDNAASVRPWNFMNEGIAVVVGDGTSGSALVNNGGDYGSINTRNFGSFRCFGYNTNLAEHRASLMDFLNTIKEGDYVFLFTVVKNSTANLGTEDWENDRASYGTTLFEVLENNGAQLMDQLKEYKNVPYVFMYKKGGSVLDESITESIFGEVNAEGFVPILNTEGEMKSVRIGPATAWSRVEWEASFDQEEDQFSLEVVGIKTDGDEETLIQNQPLGTIDLSSIDANIFPQIRLVFKSKDEKARTPPNPEFLRVLFAPLPEFIFSNKGAIRFARDTLLQGENMEFEHTIENIGGATTDSIQIRYSLIDNQNSELMFRRKIKALDNEESAPVTFIFNTSEALGKYQFSTQINPEPSQAEQFYFNNVGIKNFEVVQDRANPILDVTFDGIRIMDEDIVAASPEIIITLQDENPYFLIDDPAYFDIQLDTGNIASLVTISADDPALEFTPATSENLEAKLIYRPTLKDGTYTLHVQGKDASGNVSGDNKYSVSFKVVDRNMVSNVFNYPNPFSTRTQFVFTLTGEVPNDLKIQIMTVSGKVVREIRKDELGDLRVGLNRTDYWWDGTDEYGDKLANGVYLYRLVLPKSLDYENFELNSSGNNLDGFFKEGFGKMVIMR